jgi:hypothetical protein
MSILRRFFGMSVSDADSKPFAIDPSTLAASQRVPRQGHCTCLASRTKKGTPSVPNLHTDAQDVTVPGWHLLLELARPATAASPSAFEPLAMIPADQRSAVITLPPSISDLKTVTTLRLYGSHLRRLPPEVGRMTALSNLDVYTSYSLHWLPYEITRCSALNESRVSTRALYGNIKTRLPFPRLSSPVDTLMPQTCSVCDDAFREGGVQVLWTTQRVATDVVPLLIHSCSSACTSLIPDAPEGYYPRPHRGGGGVGMPDPEFD